MHVSVITSPFPSQAIHVQDGDILVVRLPENTNNEVARQVLSQVMEGLRSYDHKQVHVIACIGEFHIDHFDEQAMKKIGWVRDGTS